MRGVQKCLTVLLFGIWATTVGPALLVGADAIQIEVGRDIVTLRPSCAADGEAQIVSGSQVLESSTALTTDGLGRARLHLAAQADVTVFHDSCLEVRPADLPADGLQLIRGTLLVAAEGAGIVITAPEVWVEATGQVLVYRNARQNVVWVAVKRGTGRVQANGGEMALTAGQQTWVEAGMSPSQPAPAARSVIGGRFPLLDDLTNGILADSDWLRDRISPLWLLIALALVAVMGLSVWLTGRLRRPTMKPAAAAVGAQPAAAAGPRSVPREVGLRPLVAEGASELIPIHGGALTVGRLSDNNVPLQDNRISSHHARIVQGPDGFAVEDLGSRNGTFVNDQRVVKQALKEGDVVRFAQFAFIFGPASAMPAIPRLASPIPQPQPAEETPRPAPPAVTAPPTAGLRVLQPDGQGQFIPLRQERLRIGRHLDNDLSLPDPLASGHHATITCQADSYFIEDMQSRNGTFVNGRRITRQQLHGGEQVQIGDMPLRFEVEPPAGPVG